MIDVDQIINLGRENADITKRITSEAHPDNEKVTVPVVLEDETDENGGFTTKVRLAEDILAELDKRMPGPRRREGRVTLLDVASFCEYLARYQKPESSVVYANVQAMTFEAVIDEHPLDTGTPDDAVRQTTAWRGHRATYTCPRSPEWIAWTAHDGKVMTQDAFADFIEERLEHLAAVEGYPKPIEMLQVARQLHIRTKGTFQRETNPTNGDFILVNKTETETGSTVIPRAFALAIPVFEGGERYQVEARVRFAIGERGPQFSYTLHRRSEIERDAFAGVRKIVGDTTKLPVLSGTP